MKLNERLNTDRPGLEGLDDVAALAGEAALTLDAAPFHAAFRRSELPFLLKHYRDDPRGLFETTMTTLHALGEQSPAIALGVSQHLASMLAFSLATSLLSGDDSSSVVVNRLLQEAFDNRLLIANTTSHAGGKKIGESGSTITRVEDGYIVDGFSTFMSLATEADKVVFLTQGPDGGLVGVVSDLANNPALRVSDELLFGDYLALADTRKLHFDQLTVPDDFVIGPDARLNVFYSLQLLCHNLCVASLYLGGAHRILEETKRFSHETVLSSGAQLATSESFSANIGQLVIEYSTSLQLILSVIPTAERLFRAEKLDQRDVAESLAAVSAIKYSVAKNIEHIAMECRKLIGTRAFMSGHPVARIGAEVIFAALGPATEKLIERNFGTRYLEV